MIEICLEIVDENWAEWMLQVHAFVLIGELINVHLHRMNESFDRIGGYFLRTNSRFNLFTCANETKKKVNKNNWNLIFIVIEWDWTKISQKYIWKKKKTN